MSVPNDAPSPIETGEPCGEFAKVWFAERAIEWKRMYEQDDVTSVVHQLRLEIALGFVDRVRIGHGARALDVGCGAGVMTAALGERGARVYAVDAVMPMLELTRSMVAQRGVMERTVLTLGDGRSLPFRDRAFDLVVALGVLPWIPSSWAVLAEMSRVLAPGGFLIVSGSNRIRLTWLLDPLNNPFLMPFRRAVKFALRWMGFAPTLPRDHQVTMHTPKELDRLLSSVGLEKVAGSTFGFGPFTFFLRPAPDWIGLRLHRRLQPLADRRVPVLRSTGAQYIVLARAPRAG